LENESDLNVNSSDYWDGLDNVSEINGTLYNWTNYWTKNGSNGDLFYLGGNIGIGTENPGSELEVQGDANVSGDINNSGQVNFAGGTLQTTSQEVTVRI